MSETTKAYIFKCNKCNNGDVKLNLTSGDKNTQLFIYKCNNEKCQHQFVHEDLDSLAQFSREDIKQKAEEFVKYLFGGAEEWETDCPICTAINCINNETCINCGYTLKN